MSEDTKMDQAGGDQSESPAVNHEHKVDTQKDNTAGETSATLGATASTKDDQDDTELATEAFHEEQPTEWEIPDDIPSVNEDTIDKLVQGVMEHVVPEFKKAKSSLDELTDSQKKLIGTLYQENKTFSECLALGEVTETMDKAKVYYNKLLNIRKEMIALHEKSGKLKKRALKLQQQKQKEALQREQEREKELEKERMLIARPSKSPHHNTL